jgi:hypothetical protein
MYIHVSYMMQLLHYTVSHTRYQLILSNSPLVLIGTACKLHKVFLTTF